MFEKYGHSVVVFLCFAFLSWVVSHAVADMLFQQLHFTARGAVFAGIWVVLLTVPLLCFTPLLISCVVLAAVGVGINEAGIRASASQGEVLSKYANAHLMLASIIFLASVKSESEQWLRNTRSWRWRRSNRS